MVVTYILIWVINLWKLVSPQLSERTLDIGVFRSCTTDFHIHQHWGPPYHSISYRWDDRHEPVFLSTINFNHLALINALRTKTTFLSLCLHLSIARLLDFLNAVWCLSILSLTKSFALFLLNSTEARHGKGMGDSLQKFLTGVYKERHSTDRDRACSVPNSKQYSEHPLLSYIHVLFSTFTRNIVVV